MMSDCEKCWETPCICGYDYANCYKPYLENMRDLFQSMLDGTNTWSGPNNKITPEYVNFDNLYRRIHEKI